MQKELYEVPTISVVEMKQEGVICQSPAGAGVNNYTWNDPVIE